MAFPKRGERAWAEVVVVGAMLAGCGGDDDGDDDAVEDAAALDARGDGAIGPGTWTPLDPPPDGFADHVAVRLADGRVLVAGGGVGNAETAEAALFDPATTTWQAAPPMLRARRAHAAALAANGRVVVVGGLAAGAGLERCEYYEPAAERWVDAPPFVAPRHSVPATVLDDGRVFVTGGSVDVSAVPLSSTWTLAGGWRQGPDLAFAQTRHEQLLLPDGSVLVAGNNSERFLPGDDAFTDDSLMIRTRRFFALALVGADAIAIGGEALGTTGALSSTERYDVTTAVWSSGQPLLHARRNPTATTLGDGTVLVVGGDDLGSGTAATTAERWNGARWIEAPAPPIAFTRHTATLLADGSVLLVGPDGAALFEP